MKVRVFYHDKCFDGACSASLFTRVHQECFAAANRAEYSYHGLVHRAGSLFDESTFTGDENAIVDFKYSASPRVTWWFDHHLSAFLTPEDHLSYLAGLADPTTGFREHRFFDPKYTSCTGFIADTAAEHFGFDTSSVADLVHWANIVDGALYESATAAVEMREAAMKLTLVIESTQDPELIPRLIPLLTQMPLGEILEQPFVSTLLPPLLEGHAQALEIIRERAACVDKTIFFDVADREIEGYNKFIPYYLFPEAIYSVGLSKSSFRTKVAVGTNPWTDAKPSALVNLAAICERYGGGGHARVGAISFPPDSYAQAKQASREIVGELRGHASVR